MVEFRVEIGPRRWLAGGLVAAGRCCASGGGYPACPGRAAPFGPCRDGAAESRRSPRGQRRLAPQSARGVIWSWPLALAAWRGASERARGDRLSRLRAGRRDNRLPGGWALLRKSPGPDVGAGSACVGLAGGGGCTWERRGSPVRTRVFRVIPRFLSLRQDELTRRSEEHTSELQSR